MTRKVAGIGTIIFTFSLMLPSPVSAYEILRTVFSSGAISTSGGSYTLEGTIGEAVIAEEESDGTHFLSKGFWSRQDLLITVDVPPRPVPDANFVNALRPAVPNPFGNGTSIAYSVATSSPVRLAVFNVNGRRVRTLVAGQQEPGAYSVVWDGRDDHDRYVLSGVYFCKLDIGAWSRTQKVMKLR